MKHTTLCLVLAVLSILCVSVESRAQSATSGLGPAVDSLWRASTPSPVPISLRLLGNREDSGAFHYYFQPPAGASLSAHRHSVDMHITIRFGRKYILMGTNLDSARVKRFEAGSSLVIPAGVWHVEWWETDTLEDITGVGPMRTERANPATPRTQ